jgi:hypothetical protein
VSGSCVSDIQKITASGESAAEIRLVMIMLPA